MQRSWSFSASWSRYFGLPRRDMLSRRQPLDPAGEDWRLALLGAHLPEAAQLDLMDGLRGILRARRRWPQARRLASFQTPEERVERARFGRCGEQLRSQPSGEVQRLLCEETKEMVRTLEADLSRTMRNWRLAMHCARIGQLYAELARQERRLSPLEKLHRALAALRDIPC